MITDNVDLYFADVVDQMVEIVTVQLVQSQGYTQDLEVALESIDKDELASSLKEAILKQISFDELQEVEKFMHSELYKRYMEVSTVIGTTFQDTLAELAGDN